MTHGFCSVDTTDSEMEHLHGALLMMAGNNRQARIAASHSWDPRNSLCIPDDKSGTGRCRRMYVYFRKERLTSEPGKSASPFLWNSRNDCDQWMNQGKCAPWFRGAISYER